jgi:hypothetical protein
MLLVIGPLALVALAMYGVCRSRAGRALPRFVHGLAAIGLALGAWMAWLDFRAAELTWPIAFIEITLMPAIVYVAFFVFFYGRAPRGEK